MQSQPFNINTMARRAHAELVIEDYQHTDPIAAISQALAEVWQQGDHGGVRAIISNSLTREIKVRVLRTTRSHLSNELMKDAFDRYMQGV